ncbi:MAG TPA: protease modulator HflC [Acidiferrobacter sp.]|nr:protease modulator HflC [Acidiferrobacter sp.]
MSIRLLWPLVVGLALIGVVLDATVYTVDQGQCAVVTNFGRVIASRVGPGLHVKIPFIDSVHVLSTRLLGLQVAPGALLTKGQDPLFVDAFVEWRIQSFRRYFTSVGGLRPAADERLRQVATSAIRRVVGTRSLKAVIAYGDKGHLTQMINGEVARYGITVEDVRIRRIGLADGVRGAIEKRMTADRLRQAAQLKSTGMAEAGAIRNRADRKRAAIQARAYEQAEAIRGDGDVRAGMIYTRAYRRYPHFFLFYNSLRAYVKSFGNHHTILVVGPHSGFMRFLPNNSSYRK